MSREIFDQWNRLQNLTIIHHKDVLEWHMAMNVFLTESYIHIYGSRYGTYVYSLFLYLCMKTIF